MSERIIETTSLSQREWNICLQSRNKQLTKELKEFRIVSNEVGCSSSQLLALSQLYRLQSSPAYGIINNEREWNNLFSMLDVLYGSPLVKSLLEYNLTAQEIKLCYLIRARLKNKVIAILFNITVQSVIKEKQRIKQKMGLLPADNFDKYIQDY